MRRLRPSGHLRASLTSHSGAHLQREATPRGEPALREGSLHALDRGRLPRAMHENDHPPWRPPACPPIMRAACDIRQVPRGPRKAHTADAMRATGSVEMCRTLGRPRSRWERPRVLGSGLRVVLGAVADGMVPTRTHEIWLELRDLSGGTTDYAGGLAARCPHHGGSFHDGARPSVGTQAPAWATNR